MMELSRFGALCEAYGGDPRRWPEAERGEAAALAAADPRAAQMLAEADALDALLGASRPTVPSPALRDRVLGSAPRLRTGFRLGVDWMFKAGLGAGLAAAGAAGVLVGSTLIAPGDEPASAAALAALELSPEATAFGPAPEAQEG